MGQYNITNHYIFPTEGDVHNGQGAGLGIVRTEQGNQYLSKVFTGRGNYVIIGFGLPSSGSLTNSISGGTAVVDGYVVSGTGSNTVSFEASTTVHVVLKLTYSNGKVVGAIFETFAQVGIPIIPTGSVYLGYVITGASTITSSFSAKAEGFHAWGAIKFSSSNARHDIEGGSSNWYTDNLSAPLTTFSIKFPVALPRTPRFIVAHYRTSAGVVEVCDVSSASTTEVVIARKAAASMAGGDYLNFEIRE